jgi:polar amino acid transport system substrate-binding protein
VIGLGLLGQLTALLLRAAGIRVAGIDINPSSVKLASSRSADLALLRDDPGVEESIRHFTGGLGCDAVIITAGSSSLDLINFGGAIARKRGTVVVVGAVPTGFDRDPHYYRKELQVRMSCSYGPGRYDPAYEEKGIDYPPGYVRWTEKRNMEAFQALLSSGRLDVSFLTTHVFKLEEAPAAYDLMMERSEPFVGLLVKYEVSKPAAEESRIVTRPPARAGARVGIGFIGAGSYAQGHLLPNLPRGGGVRLVGVMTSSGTGSRSVADRFGFEYCTGDEREIFGNPEIDTVFVATRHDSHAEYVVKALQARKNVFVEKPLALTYDELARIEEAYAMACRDDGAPILMVGYNRRFSPLAQGVKAAIGRGPVAMTYRVNAGAVPVDSWIQDPDVGGGRVIGEVCHFVDLLSFLAGAKALRVHAAYLRAPGGLQDTLTANVSFEDGSIASLAYFANGGKALPKERLEVFANGCSYVLDDFRRLETYVKGSRGQRKLLAQDKGQRQEVRQFIEHLSSGRGPPIPFDDLWRSSLLTFAIHESLRTGHSVELAGTRPLAGARGAASA